MQNLQNASFYDPIVTVAYLLFKDARRLEVLVSDLFEEHAQ